MDKDGRYEDRVTNETVKRGLGEERQQVNEKKEEKEMAQAFNGKRLFIEGGH